MIRIRGARTHNLKDVDLDIPSGKLTVITGVSGSGKSSLAFDTLFAEGQRQYVESLSIHSRQLLQQLPRPDLDSIEGLQPTLCINQRPNAANPRSTVGTITEIYDYLRLLMSRCGTPECYSCGNAILHQTSQQILDIISQLPLESRLVILAPMIRGKKGSHRETFQTIRKAGLVRMRVDGEVYEAETPPELNPQQSHTIDGIVDRIVLRQDSLDRIADALSVAIKMGSGSIAISYLVPNESPADRLASWQERIFSTRYSCPDCGISYEELEPRTFSFNSPYGACPDCSGIGYRVSTAETKEGEEDNEKETPDPTLKGREVCVSCKGSRLRREATAVKLNSRSIVELSSMSMLDALAWFEDQSWNEAYAHVAAPIVEGITNRLRFLKHVGVDYLSLNRTADTLSGGELQRVRLATCIGSGLVGVCYVLDEPSIGLHPRDNARLIEAIRGLQARGNTVVVVEHDDAMMQQCDWLVDLGPRAGVHGGEVVSFGKPDEVLRSEVSLTAAYLRGDQQVAIPAERRKVDSQRCLQMAGVTTNNLRGVDVTVPLGLMVGITGVSGSGKSSLILETLVPALEHHFGRPTARPGPYRSLSGIELIDKLVSIDQQPIGRSPRSTPATFCGAFDEMRKLFAVTREAKQRGFTAKRFSFNSGNGRCEACQGQGLQKIDMGFLSDIFVACGHCQGTRFNRQTLQVRYKGKNIAECLEMSIGEAVGFFENIDKIHRVFACMDRVGLGYLKLGQSANTLSGGESQRVKLATELARLDTGKTLYVLDEPTTGLHVDDVRRLIEVMDGLVQKGNTVLVIEHHLEVMKCCDWLIDLGPEGGRGGGFILAEGTPESIAAVEENSTGRWLQPKLGIVVKE